MHWLLTVAGAGLGLWILGRLFALGVTRFERIDARGHHSPLPSTTPVHPYLTAVAASLGEAGFEGTGSLYAVARSGKASGVQAGIWRSSDGRIMAHAEAGSLMGMDIRRLTLRSRLEGGHVIDSSDQMQMPDISGSWEPDFLYNADVAELITFHKTRLEGRGAALPLDQEKLLEEHEELELSRARRLEQLGLAQIHPGGNTWGYTWRGAIKLQSAWKPQKAKMWAQADRLGRLRPGDPVEA